MQKILAYGEIMLRISLDSEINSFMRSTNFGGCEANALVFLSQRGYDCEFLSSFPDNLIGKEINSFLKSLNVKCNINFDKERLGVYYTSTGKNNKPTKISYDRKDTSFSKYLFPKVELHKILKDKKYVIISGITPALSQECQKNILNLIDTAKLLNVKIIYDINYRPTLWSIQECRRFNRKILNHVDFLFTNSKTLRDLFEIKVEFNEVDMFQESEQTLKKFFKTYEIPCVGMTIRKNNKLATMINYQKTNFKSQIFEINQIDRVGAGDSFLASVIHGILSGWDLNKIISFSTSSFALAHTFKGDFNQFTDTEIINFTTNSIN